MTDQHAFATEQVQLDPTLSPTTEETTHFGFKTVAKSEKQKWLPMSSIPSRANTI
ncbi:hypothetical protein AAUPMC_17445 [Pasteurella multocida subsp. multocida str. Anand1_cattle]|nr:hypothetical protein AAUPMC_17445 [Pasteurella multocida subsp. multocida str. Anand1_cattle]